MSHWYPIVHAGKDVSSIIQYTEYGRNHLINVVSGVERRLKMVYLYLPGHVSERGWRGGLVVWMIAYASDVLRSSCLDANSPLFVVDTIKVPSI